MSLSRFFSPLALAAALVAGPSIAAPDHAVVITLKNHRFTPAAFNVPAGRRVRITLINQDMATEEFDSHDLRVEKLVTPNASITFFIGPLAPGEYSFMGEFHPDAARGRITVGLAD